MTSNNLLSGLVALMVCGLIVGACAVPLIASATMETVTVDYNDEDNAGWLRMNYGTDAYNVSMSIDDDVATIGTQTGTADDMITYADAHACIISYDGVFYIVNGYADNPEVIPADSVTVTNENGTITIVADGDTIISSTSPAWAYYPANGGNYAYFGADVDGVKVKTGDQFATAGTFAKCFAYNDTVVGVDGIGDMGLSLDVEITDNVINSVKWATEVIQDDNVRIRPVEIKDNDKINDGTKDADPVIGTRVGDLYYYFYTSSCALIGYSSTIDWATLTSFPDTVTYNGVTYTITSIGNSAFFACNNLNVPSLPSGVTSIAYGAFKGCTNLALTELPSGLTTIDGSAFQGCTNLALTELPSGLTSIGTSAFSGCTNLALTELPSGLTSIAQSTFSLCSNLALTELPSGVTSIGRNAFYDCTNLALTELPSGLTSIEDTAFYQCTGLESLVIQSASYISSDAFYGCTNLKEILDLGGNTIVGTNAEILDYIPAMGYIASLTTVATVQGEGAVYDVLALVPFVMVVGVIIAGVQLYLTTRL